MPDWRSAVLHDLTPLPGAPALQCATAAVGGERVVVAGSDFGASGGTFGEAEATAFVGAADEARRLRRPLVSILRSGGTRVTEGMHALVGIPRVTLALEALRGAAVPHVSVMEGPTTGGVWVAIGCTADVRIAVAGGVVAFSGPRAVEAMTGRVAAPGTGTAESAWRAGLVDAVVPAGEVAGRLTAVLRTLRPDDPSPVPAAPATAPPAAAPDGWQHVVASREEPRPDGARLLSEWLDERVALTADDRQVVACLARLGGRRVAAVALAGRRGGMPGPAGFALLSRAARLAGALDLGLVVLVDTPGADPHREAEGIAPAIAAATREVLHCPAPTVCLVHGDGGSGGALAGAVTDRVGVGPAGWFAALSPEGAAAAVRSSVEEVTRRMAVTPPDLLASRFADAAPPAGTEAAWIARMLDELRELPAAARLGARFDRWSGPLS